MKLDVNRFQNKEDEYFYGEHFEGYGDKWEGLDMSGEIVVKLTKYVTEGELIIEQEINGSKYFGLIYPENTAVQAMSIIRAEKKSNSFMSIYPVLEGIPNELKLKSAYAWEILAEGEMAAETNLGNIINFHNTYFARDIENFEFDKKQSVALAGLAYALEPLKEKVHKITTGDYYEVQLKEFLEENPDKAKLDFKAPEIMLDDRFRMFMPRSTTSIYEAVGQIKDIKQVKFADRRITAMKVNFEHSEEDEYLYCNLYATENTLKGYTPRIGDTVHTSMWLNGYFV